MHPISLRRVPAAVAVGWSLVRARWRSGLFRAMRLTGAAVASYVVAGYLGTSPQPLVAALTALLVVQVTLTETLVNSIQRVGSVVAGVGLAIVFSLVVGLTWWSLAALIAASIIAGQIMRLGPHLVEVPISAMLVLGVGFGAEAAAEDRAIETLIGAVVGVLTNVAFPPAVRARDAGAQVARFADEIAALAEVAAGSMAEPLSREQTSRWQSDARRLTRHVPRLDRLLSEVERSRQLNLRSLGLPDSEWSLRGGLDALEHCSVTVRTLLRSMDDAAAAAAAAQAAATDAAAAQAAATDAAATDAAAGQILAAPVVRDAFERLLQHTADAIRSFGRLIQAEVDTQAGAEMEDLTDALRELRATRIDVHDDLLVDPRQDPVLWQLSGALLATVDRVVRELDAEDHARLRPAPHSRPAPKGK